MNLLVKFLLMFLLACPIVHSAMFIDIDDGVVVSDDDDLDNTTFTLVVWMKPTDVAGNAKTTQFMKKNTTGGSGRNHTFNWDHTSAGTEQSCGFQDTGNTFRTTQFGTTITDDVWHHLACTYNGTSLIVYLDGVSDGSSSPGTTPKTGAGDLKLIEGAGSNTVKGEFSDAAIYDTALAVADIKRLYDSKLKRMPLQVLPSNLMAYWPLDDFADGVSADGLNFIDMKNGHSAAADDGAANDGMSGAAEEVLSYL